MIQQESKGEELSSFQRLFIILLFDLFFFFLLFHWFLCIGEKFSLLAVFCSFREAFQWRFLITIDVAGSPRWHLAQKAPHLG